MSENTVLDAYLDRGHISLYSFGQAVGFILQHLVYIRGAFSHRNAYHVGYLLSSGKTGRLQDIMGQAVAVGGGTHPGNIKVMKKAIFLMLLFVSWQREDNSRKSDVKTCAQTLSKGETLL